MIMNPTAIKHVVVDGHSLTLESFVAIARYNATVELAPSALEAMKKSRALAEKIAERALKPTQEPFRCAAVSERSPPLGENCLKWEQHKARREGHKARQNPSCCCPWQQAPVLRAGQGSLKSCAEGKAPFRWRAVHKSPLHAAGLSAASTGPSKASSPADPFRTHGDP